MVFDNAVFPGGSNPAQYVTNLGEMDVTCCEYSFELVIGPGRRGMRSRPLRAQTTSSESEP